MSHKTITKMNKNFFSICILLIFSISLNAQEKQSETYIITDNGSVKNVQSYIDALNSANMKYHRLKNKRYTVFFDTGVTVELFSATELIANGRNISLSDYPDNFDLSRQEPIFLLGQNNFILEQKKPLIKNKK